MSLCDVYLEPEVAFDVLSDLGEMDCVQVIDMHPEIQLFQKKFIQEVCRCSNMERKLRFLESSMKFHNISINVTPEVPRAAPIHELLGFAISMNCFEVEALRITTVTANTQKTPLIKVNYVLSIINKWVNDLEQINENEQSIMKNYLELEELLYMLKYIGPLLGQSEIHMKRERAKAFESSAVGDSDEVGRLFILTGVLKRTKAYTFELMLWRLSRGMIYYRQASEDTILKDPLTYRALRKVAFLAICQGQELAARVKKVCAAFKVNTYPCPNTYKERMDMINNLNIRVYDLEIVLTKSRYLRCKALRTISKQWTGWLAQVRKAKAIYHQMNYFSLDITRNVLIGQMWVPDHDLEKVKAAIAACCQAHQTNVESFISVNKNHKLTPPTYNRTNKFTHGFQALINAYGTSVYRELNPGLYTIITFPFLFGIMFGDVGHGFIMFSFAAWMWKNEKRFLAESTDNEIWQIIFGGRYIILLMGAFSMFSGMCYNDFFGIPFAFWGSSYFKNPYSVEELKRDEMLDIDPRGPTGSVYPIGFDPIWALSKNSIMIQNSLKMKISIIVGIIHMIFGVILSIVNYRYFGRRYSIFLQFIPEFVFLVFLFFWLVIMIFWKWIVYSAKRSDPELNTACAPQILILFIDMALMAESQPADEKCTKAYFFEGQRSFQMFLLLVSLCMVPLLLFGTPLYKLRVNKHLKKKAIENLKKFRGNIWHSLTVHDYEIKEKELKAEVEKYSLSFGELMIYQGVHTIEYVLSTISHTASYLRLWALSLAHAQLAHMLFHMVMAKLALHCLDYTGPIRVFVIFSVWAVFSVCILVVMEGLSAFLHTLRLHWVEFMSKFFAGGGVLFQPFSLREIYASAESETTAAGCKKLMLLTDFN